MESKDVLELASEARAIEIERRYNCHDELVAALEWMLADGMPGQMCGGHGGSSCCCNCAREKAMAAIAKAKGGAA